MRPFALPFAGHVCFCFKVLFFFASLGLPGAQAKLHHHPFKLIPSLFRDSHTLQETRTMVFSGNFHSGTLRPTPERLMTGGSTRSGNRSDGKSSRTDATVCVVTTGRTRVAGHRRVKSSIHDYFRALSGTAAEYEMALPQMTAERQDRRLKTTPFI
ncbi:hypothetical protein IWZ01DRAFT_156596 [Phyllosticta capitalensis]